MISRKFSLAVFFLLTSCTYLRPIVIEPNIVVVVNNNDNVDNGSNVGTKSINLPICYLENCAGETDASCASKAFSFMSAKRSPVWKMLEKKPAAIITFAPQGYYSSAKRATTLKKIASSWAEIGCVDDPNTVNNTASMARSRECNRHMKKWVVLINNGPISDLGADVDFRRACQRDTP